MRPAVKGGADLDPAQQGIGAPLTPAQRCPVRAAAIPVTRGIRSVRPMPMQEMTRETVIGPASHVSPEHVNPPSYLEFSRRNGGIGGVVHSKTARHPPHHGRRTADSGPPLTEGHSHDPQLREPHEPRSCGGIVTRSVTIFVRRVSSALRRRTRLDAILGRRARTQALRLAGHVAGERWRFTTLGMPRRRSTSWRRASSAIPMTWR